MPDTLVDSIGVEFVLVLPVRVTQPQFTGPSQQSRGVPPGKDMLVVMACDR